MTRLTGGWQVVIFVKSVARAIELDKLLVSCNFPSIAIHSGLSQEERCVQSVPGPVVITDCHIFNEP